MSGVDPGRVQELFDQAAELPTPDRSAFLDKECAGDAALRREVEELLAHDALAPTRFLSGAADPDDLLPGESVGDTVGRYRLEEKIGEGGFGVVYRAHQQAPVERDVALKIIKVGMDTRRVVRQFETERQTLAQLSHPNTTRVLDAGSTGSGRPYFVMELVDGEPITTYCENHGLSVDDRLGLFLQTCAAVQHAHQRAIIHRDIKPSNVMVQRIDGEPSVKVIDFGIARALDQPDSPRTLATLQGAVIGTPEYMSPEQAAGESLDTRTDVYSLGVLLYELLAGAHPFAAEFSRTRDITERLRLVREVDPPRPSTRIADGRPAGSRDISRQLIKALRGDLDWIVMRALEKSPARRYASVADLAADIRRHQSSEPVSAGPPGRAYRINKFVRRHRVGVFAGSVAGAAVVLGMAGLFAGMAQARAEAERARREAARATQIATLLKDVFAGVNPAVTRGREAPVLREILAGAAERIERSLDDDPLAEAELLTTIGKTQLAIGEYNPALISHRRAYELLRARLGDADRDTLAAADGVASALNFLGRHAEAAAFMEDALSPWRGRAHTASVGAELHTLGSIYRDQGELALALATMQESLREYEAEAGADSLSALSVRHDIAAIHARLEQYDDAERIHREVYEKRIEHLGEDHPDTLYSMNSLAYLYGSLRRFDDGEPFYRRTLEGRRRVLGEDHPETLTSINNLAFLYARLGRLDEAEILFREALDRQSATLGDSHPLTLLSLNNIGAVLVMQGRHEAAAPFLHRAYEGRRDTLGADHHFTLFSAHRAGENLRELGRLDDAAHYFRLAADGRARTHGPSHADTLASVESLAGTLAADGRPASAIAILDEHLLSIAGDDESARTARDRLRNARNGINAHAHD